MLHRTDDANRRRNQECVVKSLVKSILNREDDGLNPKLRQVVAKADNTIPPNFCRWGKGVGD